ncbi:MAG: 1-acyl-sn-glycerol-3-phosphate acyltransferase [Pseudomonadota bacterium]
MTSTIELPIWALVVLLLFAAVTFASHFLFPSVRWFFRKRAERLVAKLNDRLTRPIEPFKIARRVDTINRLTHDPAVAQAIQDHARDQGIPEQVAFETARRYAREIVPGFSATLYFSVATRMARWLSKSLYRVRVTGEAEALSQVDPDTTVIFVLNHRSNMDYVLVTWLAARQTALAYAVGEWARRWPLRPLIRAMGGYFVRRQDLNPLYRKVLARYVQIATRNGVTQAVFPEGRLSRTGDLHPPKLGILSYVVGEHDPGTGRNVAFIPVAVNYERVLEDRVLIAAGTKGSKAFRLRWWMIFFYLVNHLKLRLTGRFTRFGYAAVSFGAPVSLNEFAIGQKGDITSDLAETLMARIAQALPILPVPLVCDALARGARDVAVIASHIETRAATLRSEGFPLYHQAREARQTALIALRMLESRTLLRLNGEQIVCKPESDVIFDYYARTLPPHKSGET